MLNDDPQVLEKQFEEFLGYMQRNHKSKTSLRSYGNTFRLFIADGYTHLTTETVEAFLEARYDNPATFNKALNHLRSFSKWTQRRGVGYYGTTVGTIMVEQQKVDLSLPEVVADADADRLINRLKDRHIKTWAFLVLKCKTGMRFSEVRGIRPQHFHVLDGDVPALIFRGKGRSERIVPLNEEAVDAFRIWVSGEEYPCPNTIRYQITEAEKELGIAHVKPHWFRHTVATKLSANGASAESIADLLGNTVEVVRARYRRMDHKGLSRLTGML